MNVVASIATTILKTRLPNRSGSFVAMYAIAMQVSDRKSGLIRLEKTVMKKYAIKQPLSTLAHLMSSACDTGVILSFGYAERAF